MNSVQFSCPIFCRAIGLFHQFLESVCVIRDNDLCLKYKLQISLPFVFFFLLCLIIYLFFMPCSHVMTMMVVVVMVVFTQSGGPVGAALALEGGRDVAPSSRL